MRPSRILPSSFLSLLGWVLAAAFAHAEDSDSLARSWMDARKDSPLKRQVQLEHPASAQKQRQAFEEAVFQTPYLQVSQPAMPWTEHVRWIQNAPSSPLDGQPYALELWRPAARNLVEDYPSRARALSTFAKAKNLPVIGAALQSRLASHRSTQEALTILQEDIDYPVFEFETHEVHATYEEVAISAGLPCLLLIGSDGNLAWIGEDLGEASQVLASLREGRYSAERARQADQNRVARLRTLRIQQPGAEQKNYALRMAKMDKISQSLIAQGRMPEQNAVFTNARQAFGEERFTEAYLQFAALPETEGIFSQQVLKSAAEFLATQALSGRGDRERNLDLAYDLALEAKESTQKDWRFSEGGLFLVLRVTELVLEDRLHPVPVEKRPIYESRLQRHQALLEAPPNLGPST
ncbi:MAG: hypothetical protein AAGJ31_15910, partial [Verrucomicrobiota bacterium]